MKPVNYTIDDEGSLIFHYKFSDLRKFVIRGRIHGNVGMIFVKAMGKFHLFKGYGTIEAPCTDMMHVTLVHEPLFDGKFDPDFFVNRDIRISQDSDTSFSMTLIDLSKPKEHDN